MKYKSYSLEASERFTTFTFTSAGAKGHFIKLIRFTPTAQEGVFNLSLENYDPETAETDDIVLTNIGDMAEILATVVMAVRYFFSKYPEAGIVFLGNTEAKTRLYRIAIANNLEELEKDFLILGNINGELEYFSRNRLYQGFVVFLR